MGGFLPVHGAPGESAPPMTQIVVNEGGYIKIKMVPANPAMELYMPQDVVRAKGNDNSNKKQRSASDQKLINEAQEAKAKEREQNRQAASSQGKNKTGKSNQDVRGSHHTNQSGGDRHDKRNRRAKREQSVADEKKKKMVRVRVINKEYQKKILALYSKAVGTDSKKARDLIKRLDYERDPDLLERIAQTYFDESLFNTDGSQREWFDGRKLRLAEKYIIEAYNLNENSVYVLWTLGKIRKAYNQTDLAIYCFKRIIEISKLKIARQKKIVDFDILQSKINDSKFELYRLYYLKGDLVIAKKYLNSYKVGLKKGVHTLYSPLEKYLVDL